MTVRTAAQLKAEFQGTDPQDFANNLVDTLQAGVTFSYVYIGTKASETTTLGTDFTTVTGRVQKLGDICAYYDTAGGKYHLMFSTGTGASNWTEVLSFAL
ncbi:MAG: hypothetical protein EHM48_00410 [Planctomycetaceae bacterium]|nr:MAG: hypothetical protein EHM48_00410 [Planctomycetaceae bacterium]